MICSWCQEVLTMCPEDIYEVRYFEDQKIRRIDCPSCGRCAWLNFTEKWVSLDTLLSDEDSNKHGWIVATTSKEKEVQYILSQILYREHDSPREKNGEAVFDLADPTDLLKILWFQGHAIGFYTVKLKGTIVDATMEHYAINTLDTAYVQGTHRRQGHGTTLIANLVETFPDEDIGFSKPISESMLQVLKKYCTKNVSVRKRFWEVDGTGGEGNQKLIWFSFLKQNCKIISV